MRVKVSQQEKIVYAIGLSLLIGLLAATARGHQLHASITTVVFQTRTDTLEVTHRFFTHDAEYALRQMAGAPADVLAASSADVLAASSADVFARVRVDIVDDPRSRQRFGVYAYNRFQIRGLQDNNEVELPLTLVGVELDGDFIWVYEKAPIPHNITGLQMTNTMLRELWPEQSNTVNIERSGETQTLTFSGFADELTVMFATNTQADP